MLYFSVKRVWCQPCIRTAENACWHWIPIVILLTLHCLLLRSDLLLKLIFPGIPPHSRLVFCVCWANSNLIYFRAKNVPLLRQNASTSPAGKPIEFKRKTWKMRGFFFGFAGLMLILNTNFTFRWAGIQDMCLTVYIGYLILILTGEGGEWSLLTTTAHRASLVLSWATYSN